MKGRLAGAQKVSSREVPEMCVSSYNGMEGGGGVLCVGSAGLWALPAWDCMCSSRLL